MLASVTFSIGGKLINGVPVQCDLRATAPDNLWAAPQ